jgi:hypothetical protein
MIAAVGAMVSFEEGSPLLRELAGLAVDAKQAERAAEALGSEIAEDEKQEAPAAAALPLPAPPVSGHGRHGRSPARRGVRLRK